MYPGIPNDQTVAVSRKGKKVREIRHSFRYVSNIVVALVIKSNLVINMAIVEYFRHYLCIFWPP